MDCEQVLKNLIKGTCDYLQNHDIKCMVLGISGGIDSTVAAYICHQVSLQTGIPLIGRSLPSSTNKSDENIAAQTVGEVFCDDFKIVDINNIYTTTLSGFTEKEMLDMTLIAKGNIKARIRMNYLYNIACVKHGIVIDTDNLTEHYLGFWTLHGDEGDLDVLGDLWKTDVYELAKYIIKNEPNVKIKLALTHSINLTPTDGNGISSSDLEQFGVPAYDIADEILKKLVTNNGIYPRLEGDLMPNEYIQNISKRYQASMFKREHRPFDVKQTGIVTAKQ